VGDRWIWVSLPQYTCAVVVAGGRVVDAAPIARWAIGRDERFVADWFRRRGAKITPLGN
jgi:hypothetical protein